MKIPLILLLVINLILILIISVQSLTLSYNKNKKFLNPFDILYKKHDIIEMVTNIEDTLVLYENYTFYVYLCIFMMTFVFFILYLNNHKHGNLTKNHYMVEKQNVIINIIIFTIIIVHNNIFKVSSFGKIKSLPFLKKYGMYIITPFSIILYILIITSFINNNFRYLKFMSRNVTEFLNVHFKLNWISTKN